MIDTSLSPLLAHHILEQSLDLICTLDRDGKPLYANSAYKRVLGYSPQYVLERPISDFIHPADHNKTFSAITEVAEGAPTISFTNRLVSENGEELMFSWSAVWSEEENVIICIGRNITEQVQAKEKVREKEELHQALIEHGSDMLALIDENGNFKYAGGATSKILGYEPEQLTGLNAFTLIHPEDIPAALDALQRVLTEGGHIPLSDFRLKNAAGEWKWLETIGSNQLLNPHIKSIVLSSRDITVSKLAKLQLIESEQRFKALFENNPDMVFFESKEGVVLDTNPAVLSYFGVAKEYAVGQKITSFLPADAAVICNQKREEALEGKNVKFELEIEVTGFEDLGQIILDLSIIPVELNGEVIGLYTIAKDITAIRNSQNTIRQQARKLNNIFESITDAFFTIDKDWIFTYLNRECERLLDINKDDSIGKSILDVFPEEINGKFHKQYQYAVNTGNSVNFEAYLDRNNRWLEVRAFPYSEGLSVYFADITDRVRIEKELEKLSLVASKTTNGVVMMDSDFIIDWVNEGFSKLTGYTLNESVGKRPIELLGHKQTDYNRIGIIRKKMSNGEPVAFEILNSCKDGQDLWLSVEENPIFGEDGQITGFVSTQTDITALKKSELELTQLTKDLYRHNSDMQQFTYIVSHNLRSPVANVLGLTQLLSKLDKNSDTFDKGLSKLNKSVSNLDIMLKDLNTILSIKDVKETFNKEEVELNHVLQQVIASLQEPFDECHGSLSIDVPEHCSLSGNKAYFHSIFYNLLSNAIKYRSPDRNLQVKINYSVNESGETVLSITDNGSGFDMAKVGSRLFKIYNRFHTGAAEGRGIGLFLVKTQVEALGGRIEVQSKVNEGTIFSIYFKHSL